MPPSSWMYNNLLYLFNNARHIAGANYRVVHDIVYIDGMDEENVVLGSVETVANLRPEQYKRIFVEKLQQAKNLRETEKRNNMAEATEAFLEKARRDGDKVGTWLLALNPNIPMMMAQDMSRAIAKVMGYTDGDSMFEFASAVWNKFAAYQEANKPRLLGKSDEQN